MNRITKIMKLRECATFRQFNWPSNLAPFSRFNLIYGWNGTGKTTLSNVFRCLEKRTQPAASDAQIEFGTNTIHFADFLSHSTPSVRVFNRDFIREHVFPDDGTLPPVFVLGDTSIKAQEELDEAKSQLQAVNLNLPKARTLAKKAKDEFEKFCSDQAKAIKDSLQVSGIDPYRNYNQRNYKDCVARFDQPQQPASSALTDARKAEITRLLTQQPLDPIPLVDIWTESAQFHEADVKSILSESVVAQVLDDLKNNVALSSWIETGLKLHPEEDRTKCKFCGQSLPQQRIVELEGHFNDAVDNLTTRVTTKIQLLEAAKGNLVRKLSVKLEFYPQFQENFQKERMALELALKAMQKEYDLMISALRQKAKNLFTSLALTETFLVLDNSSIDAMNSTIEKHNKETDQLTNTKADACKEWERGAVLQSYKDYKKKNSAGAGADKKLNQLSAEQAELSSRIAAKEASLRQHRRPAAELNSDLKSYLGHGDLSLEAHETGYRILRGTSLADHLSEGEKTAIAILYFLKTLEDSSFNLAEGIVVLDDPVSSLDENSLFSAFGFIQRKTRAAGQLFLMTHNFSFFRQAKTWLKHENGRTADDHLTAQARFYMTECMTDNKGRFSTVKRLDSLLRNYESDYQYLFSVVRKIAEQDPATDLEENYHAPNVARRLLESFLSFRTPDISGDLHKLLQSVTFDEPKKATILRFCHTFSHSQMVPTIEHEASALSESKQVMLDILDLIRTTDEMHFNGLLRLTGSTP